MAEMNGVALECGNLCKKFGGLEAVREVNLRIPSGERRAIIGPNGAGKTTLFNLISGRLSVTSGKIQIYGNDITDMRSDRRVYLGLGRTFQITNLFPSLPVLENLVLAAMGLRRMKFSMLRPLATYRDLYERAEGILNRLNLMGKARAQLSTLSYGQKRQIEIAMTLITNPRVLLLDEPTEGVAPAETIMITGMIKNLDPSITVLIIEHDMDVAFEVADKITVMHEGAVFVEGSPAEIRGNSKVQEIYFGGE